MKDKKFITMLLPMGGTMVMDVFLMKHLRIASNESQGRGGDTLRSIAVQLITIDGEQLTNESYDALSIDDGLIINEVISSQMVKVSI
jgi:hypothetical protein